MKTKKKNNKERVSPAQHHLNIFLALLLFICSVSTMGAGFQEEQTYFSVHYTIDGRQSVITVTDKLLVPEWWARADKKKFTNNKTVYERANQNFKGSAYKTLQKDFPEFYSVVTKLEREIYKQESNGNIIFEPNRGDKFRIEGQVSGRVLDSERLAGDILYALKQGKYAVINAYIKEIEPEEAEKILARIKKRGGFSTSFTDNAPRESNIAKSLEEFDGLVVKAGEVVSFNKVVGRRTEELGYEPAPIILDGKFVEGIGGGVCQTSTTLFNAVLLSGLRVIESYNHSLPISYVPLGRDAMVSSASDFVFQNNTQSPIYIEAKVIDRGRVNSALVNIYGEALPRGTVFKPRVVLEELEIKEEVKGAMPARMQGYDFLTGDSWHYEKKVVENGYPARESLTYVDTVKNGIITKSRLIRKSHYKGKPRIVQYEKVWTDNIAV